MIDHPYVWISSLFFFFEIHLKERDGEWAPGYRPVASDEWNIRRGFLICYIIFIYKNCGFDFFVHKSIHERTGLLEALGRI